MSSAPPTGDNAPGRFDAMFGPTELPDPEPEQVSAVPESWIAGMRRPSATPPPLPPITPAPVPAPAAVPAPGPDAAAVPAESPPSSATLPSPHTTSEPPSPADYRSPFEGPPAGSVLHRPMSMPSTPVEAHSAPPAPVSDPLLADISWALVSDTPAPPSYPAAPVYSPQLGSSAVPEPDQPSLAQQPVAAPQPRASAIDAELLQTTRRPPSSPAAGGPLVSAVRCPVGHLNPPAAGHCRVCAGAIPVQQPVMVARPRIGVLRLSTGDVVPLDRGVILGRAPGTPTGAGRDEPYRIQLPSPDGSISRKHVEIVLQDWSVTVVDLNSTNGTLVTPRDGAPEQLAAGGSREITDGTLVNLDTDTWVRFEVTE